jgi:hypothetical protein
MHRRGRAVIASGFSLLVASSGCTMKTARVLEAPRNAQEPGSRVRHIFHGELPIADALLPDDDVVQVDWGIVDVAVFDSEPTPQQMLRVLAQRAELIVAVDMQDIRGVLVDDGKWIATRFTGIVVDVLRRSGRESVSAGETVVAGMGNGEMTIGTVRVRAGNVVRFPSHRRYLMFLGRRSSELIGAFNVIYPPLLIEHARLTAVLGPKSDKLDGKLHGMSLRDVTRQIQQIEQ